MRGTKMDGSERGEKAPKTYFLSKFCLEVTMNIPVFVWFLSKIFKNTFLSFMKKLKDI